MKNKTINLTARQVCHLEVMCKEARNLAAKGSIFEREFEELRHLLEVADHVRIQVPAERLDRSVEIFKEAKEAATRAAEAEDAKLGPERSRGLDCGFGWVVITPAKGPFVNFLKGLKLGSRKSWGKGGGWYLSMGSGIHGLGTQSISVHQAAARAFLGVLKKHGLDGYVDSRLD